jgi:hypothetical protein
VSSRGWGEDVEEHGGLEYGITVYNMLPNQIE